MKNFAKACTSVMKFVRAADKFLRFNAEPLNNRTANGVPL